MIAAVKAGSDLIAHLNRLGRPLVPAQGIGEQQRPCDAGRVIPGRAYCLSQVVVPAALAGTELGQTEIEQHPALQLLARRLGQGPAQVGR